MSESKWTFAQQFCRDFHVTASELQSRLDKLKRDSDASLHDIQAISAELSSLARSLADATGSLPSYDQRQCELQLKSLEVTAEELRPTSATKFTFKRKTIKSKTAPAAASSPSSAPQATPVTMSPAKSYICSYLTGANLGNETGEVSICDLENCIVNLLPKGGSPTDISAFHVQRATRCVFLLPVINGSILVHDLSDCVIVSGCHQFRMHNSTTVDVYLSIVSNPAIEHCTNIRFAGYPNNLASISVPEGRKHFFVQDFSHIRSTRSLNWTILPEEDWERFWPVHELEGNALLEQLARMLPSYKDTKNTP